MKMLKRTLLSILLLAGTLLTNGCGDTLTLAEGGIGGTGITSSGSITAFGSIYVNGIKFETDTAIITYAGKRVTQNDLRLGMNVNIVGTINDDLETGIAAEVSFEPTLMAPISSLSAEKNQFIIGTTLVRIDNYTIFDGIAQNNLANGMTLTISGKVDNVGIVHADYILLGAIDGLDPIESPQQTNIINITSLYDWMTGEGFVSKVNSDTEFEAEGWTLTHNETTRFVNGDAGYLIPGVHISVIGEKIGNTHILVKQLRYIVDDEFGEEGEVTSVDVANGIIYGGGVAYYVTNSTIMQDESSQATTSFGVDDISAGDWLKIYVYMSGGKRVLGRVIRTDHP